MVCQSIQTWTIAALITRSIVGRLESVLTCSRNELILRVEGQLTWNDLEQFVCLLKAGSDVGVSCVVD